MDEDELVDVNARRETLPEAVENRHDDTDTAADAVVVPANSVDVRATASTATPPPRRIAPSLDPIPSFGRRGRAMSRNVGSGRCVAQLENESNQSISQSVDDASRTTTKTMTVTTMVSAMDEDETERMDERDVAEALSRETDERKRWGILERALESESVLHFGSISDALETVAGETDVARRVAEIFAFGNLGDYRAQSGDLPALTTNQEIKLKRLSACEACASREKTVSYDDLMRAVEIGEDRELERFIIDECVAKGIIRGRFDPKNRVFKVGRVLTRDCPKSRLENLQKRLEKWYEISEDLLESISEKNRAVKHEKAKSVAHREEIDQTVEALKAQFKVYIVDPMTHSADMDEDGPSGVGAKRRR